MLASDPGLRRVSVHAGTAVADLVLPAEVPVAVLIPSIVDVLDGVEAGRRYQLSRPGAPALDAATTLARNDVRDGAVLVLSSPGAPLTAPRYDDAAEAVAATLAAAGRPWGRAETRLAAAAAATCLAGIGGLALVRNAFAGDTTDTAGDAASVGGVALVFAVIAHRAHRDPVAGLALSLIATAFAAVAGFVSVPGPPGMPNVLLAAAAAGAASVVAMRVTGCGAVTLTATACASTVLAAAALVGLLTAAPPHAIGSVTALVSLGLLGVAARVAIILAGLSPRLPPEPDPDDLVPAGEGLGRKAIRADRWLAGLLAGFASSATAGAIVTVLTGAPRPSCIAFGTLTGALLLLRSRGNDTRRALVFVLAGMTVIGATFGAAAWRAPGHGPWIAAGTAVLVGAAMCLGFLAPAVSLSPVARRSVELLESSVLVAAVPVTCWICGVYGAVRGLSLT